MPIKTVVLGVAQDQQSVVVDPGTFLLDKPDNKSQALNCFNIFYNFDNNQLN
jgi:hypothetical protein